MMMLKQLPPSVAPVAPLVARHKDPGTSGVPTPLAEAEAGNPDDVEGTTPPAEGCSIGACHEKFN